jgi:hypothetical protein
MTNPTTVLTLTLAAVAAPLAVSAQNQPPVERFYVSVSGGAQPATRSFETSSSPIVYDEPAPFRGSHHVGNGPFVDVNGGFKLWRDFAIGVGFSSFRDKDNGSLVASIPHPIFFGQLRETTATVADLRHSERAVYVQFTYTVAVAQKIDVTFGVGPTFLRVSQDVINGISVPERTQDASAVVGSETDWAPGVIVGFDGAYMFTPRYGIGLVVRYAGASVDLPSKPDLDVGGFQVGLGVRVRF